MHYSRLILLLFILLLTPAALPQSTGFGAGAIFGEPVGLQVKKWINETNSVEFAVGSSVATVNNRLTIYADYLWHRYDFIKSHEKFPVFYGFGIESAVRVNKDIEHGIRGVVGILWYPRKARFDFFIQAAPVYVLAPQGELHLNMGAGLRYFFKSIEDE